jgi:hypothetical protein
VGDDCCQRDGEREKKVLDEKKWVEKSGKLKRFELMFSLPGSLSC